MLARLNLADCQAVSLIHQESLPRGWSEMEFASLLQSPGVWGLLHELEGAATGFILCRSVPDELEVLTLAVSPHSRRQGVGRQLVEAALLVAMEMGAGRCILEVAVSNIAAQQLYQRFGFSLVNIRPSYYHTGRDPEGEEDAMVMECLIPSA